MPAPAGGLVLALAAPAEGPTPRPSAGVCAVQGGGERHGEEDQDHGPGGASGGERRASIRRGVVARDPKHYTA
ncbi:hypothetical protein GCM10009863_66540 [Streptomyces axinellae]|uniref:Secreted protein n=1 Tax=Streptomyces axinellae TaxID=552788 RepID=A0ABN3R0X6_9ACTN